MANFRWKVLHAQRCLTNPKSFHYDIFFTTVQQMQRKKKELNGNDNCWSQFPQQLHK